MREDLLLSVMSIRELKSDYASLRGVTVSERPKLDIQHLELDAT